MKMEQSGPKRDLNYRRCWNTQKNACNIQNTVKVWNQEKVSDIRQVIGYLIRFRTKISIRNRPTVYQYQHYVGNFWNPSINIDNITSVLAASSGRAVSGVSCLLRLLVRIPPGRRSLLWLWCVVWLRFLAQAHHLSRGILPTVVRRCVWSRNQEWGHSPRWAAAPQEKTFFVSKYEQKFHLT
jgi:hypothetical protein